MSLETDTRGVTADSCSSTIRQLHALLTGLHRENSLLVRSGHLVSATTTTYLVLHIFNTDRQTIFGHFCFLQSRIEQGPEVLTAGNQNGLTRVEALAPLNDKSDVTVRGSEKSPKISQKCRSGNTDALYEAPSIRQAGHRTVQLLRRSTCAAKGRPHHNENDRPSGDTPPDSQNAGVPQAGKPCEC